MATKKKVEKKKEQPLVYHSFILGSEVRDEEVNSCPLYGSLDKAVEEAEKYFIDGYFNDSDDECVYVVEVRLVGKMEPPKAEYKMVPL